MRMDRFGTAAERWGISPLFCQRFDVNAELQRQFDDAAITILGLKIYCGSTEEATARRISLAVPMASRALETTCAARDRCVSSAAFASRSSACARMIPSWLFKR